MRRREFIAILGAAAAWPLAVAYAQAPRKVWRIAIFSALSQSANSRNEAAFRDELSRLGYLPGRNVEIVSRYAEGGLDRLGQIAAELVGLAPDVIVASSNSAIEAIKRATTTIPVVMTVVGDPVGAGYVASLAKPGGNITGLTNVAEQLSGKRLQILKEVVPGLVRVAVLRHPTIPTHAVLWRETDAAARALGLAAFAVDIPEPDRIGATFAAMAREGAEAVVVLPEPILLVHRAEVTRLAAEHRLPTIYPFEQFTRAGGLIVYAPDIADLWRRGAHYVDRILKGAKPAELPVEQPTRFELIVNLKAAKGLGLTIPQSILLRADEVIE